MIFCKNTKLGTWKYLNYCCCLRLNFFSWPFPFPLSSLNTEHICLILTCCYSFSWFCIIFLLFLCSIPCFGFLIHLRMVWALCLSCYQTVSKCLQRSLFVLSSPLVEQRKQSIFNPRSIWKLIQTLPDVWASMKGMQWVYRINCSSCDAFLALHGRWWGVSCS